MAVASHSDPPFGHMRAEDLPLRRRLGSFAFIALAYFFYAWAFNTVDVPMSVGARWLAIFAYGFFVSASVIWGPWLAELYPTHLRSTAASLFNYGRIFSFAGPPLTAALSTNIGLPLTMALGAPIFILVAIVWLRLPETLEKKKAPSREPA